jgi:hypothetical protein
MYQSINNFEGFTMKVILNLTLLVSVFYFTNGSFQVKYLTGFKMLQHNEQPNFQGVF